MPIPSRLSILSAVLTAATAARTAAGAEEPQGTIVVPQNAVSIPFGARSVDAPGFRWERVGSEEWRLVALAACPAAGAGDYAAFWNGLGPARQIACLREARERSDRVRGAPAAEGTPAAEGPILRRAREVAAALASRLDADAARGIPWDGRAASGDAAAPPVADAGAWGPAAPGGAVQARSLDYERKSGLGSIKISGDPDDAVNFAAKLPGLEFSGSSREGRLPPSAAVKWHPLEILDNDWVRGRASRWIDAAVAGAPPPPGGSAGPSGAEGSSVPGASWWSEAIQQLFLAKQRGVDRQYGQFSASAGVRIGAFQRTPAFQANAGYYTDSVSASASVYYDGAAYTEASFSKYGERGSIDFSFGHNAWEGTRAYVGGEVHSDRSWLLKLKDAGAAAWSSVSRLRR